MVNTLYININRYILTLLFISLTSLPTYSSNENYKLLDGIAIIIEDQIFLHSEIKDYIEAVQQVADQKNKKEIIDQFINDKLIINKGKKYIKESSLNYRVREYMNKLIQQAGSKEKLESYYKKSVKEIKKMITNSIMGSMCYDYLKRNKIVKDLHLTPKEVTNIVNSLKEGDKLSFISDEFIIKKINIEPAISPLKKEKIIAQLTDLKEKINKGASFSELAKEYSQDTASANNGGVIGRYKIGELNIDYENAMISLKKGEVSGPIETEYGMHIIQLLDKHNDGSFTSRHILLNTKPDKERIQEILNEIKESIIKVENKEITFENFISIISSKYKVKLSFIKDNNDSIKLSKNKIHNKLINEFPVLKEGSISKASIYDNGHKIDINIYYLDKLIEAHKPTIESDYQLLYNMAVMYKESEMLSNWLEKQRETTYIKMYI